MLPNHVSGLYLLLESRGPGRGLMISVKVGARLKELDLMNNLHHGEEIQN